ncbi:MAG: hypothetical protein C6Y20_11085 [Tagaea sp. CACIAM 22H2]|nr:hypothetical protein [Tagaea sp. CACIAM 22H2]
MDFPKRTKQQKSEAHSYAILLYKLRALGIFRNLTENDYGIDFELELVIDDQVTARVVKIQVKSAESLKLREDKTPSVGGIKQTTLNYWCELSYRTNVIAYAVDLASEKIYVSRHLFWQATRAIDGSNSSKSIEFIAAGDNGDTTAKAVTLLCAFAPSAADHVYAHTLALRRLKDFLELLGDAHQYDAGTEIDGSHFRDLLEACRILLWPQGNTIWTNEKDRRYWTSFDYWVQKSEAEGWDGLSCYAARPILSKLVPALIRTLRTYKESVLAGKYYWAHRNPQFLTLVYETVLPESDDKNSLIEWGNRYEQNSRTRAHSASYFVQMAREPKPKKVRKPRKKR